MIINFKCTDFFTLCQKENCVSLLIFHCCVALYIVEWWPQHSFDLCNIHGWILIKAFRNIRMCIVHHIYHYKIILLLVTVIYRISTNLVKWKETVWGIHETTLHFASPLSNSYILILYPLELYSIHDVLWDFRASNKLYQTKPTKAINLLRCMHKTLLYDQ